MDEWWTSFLGNGVCEAGVSHVKSSKPKSHNTRHANKTAAEIHKDWNSNHFNHKCANYSISTSQEYERTVTIISKSDIAEIELQWEL